MTDSVYKGEDFEEKVRKQVEFYFSDSNLQTDKFLWKIYEANDGWVELKTILTFGRMRQYRPEDKVIAALKESDKLVLSANEDMIRRKDPVKDFNEVKNTRKRNTVHIEGFPKDATQEDLEIWFSTKIAVELPKEKGFNSLRRIKSRAKKEFFGVIDVELKTLEDAEFILNSIELSYPQGTVKSDDETVDKKTLLKKMSLLTFQEMRESGKRFGVNDVTKRRNSFNDNRGKKFQKGGFKGKRDDRKSEKVESGNDTIDESSETKPEGEAKQDSAEVKESKPEGEVQQESTEVKETKPAEIAVSEEAAVSN
ncbi:uncharacterized protein RJT20DRAFT_1336 [Scheffersomyces xylosifermentans]|uniref:uncharacterized protein n=1 Tax=Scheffersomyces xylosifermentans TaxID=1304137 RepID=UPI00315C52F2